MLSVLGSHGVAKLWNTSVSQGVKLWCSTALSSAGLWCLLMLSILSDGCSVNPHRLLDSLLAFAWSMMLWGCAQELPSR